MADSDLLNFCRRVPVILSLGLLACGGGGPSSPQGGDNAKPDADGDGFTSGQGDCNDSDPQVKPGGGFELKAVYGRSGLIACAAPFTEFFSLSIKNNSCDSLSVTNVKRTQEDCVISTLTGDYTPYIMNRVAPPGQEVKLLETPPWSQPYSRCCCIARYPPPPGVSVADFCTARGVCTTSFTYEVTTSSGTQSSRQSYSVVAGECPQCPTSDYCL
jgi:hypothetical protein